MGQSRAYHAETLPKAQTKIPSPIFALNVRRSFKPILYKALSVRSVYDFLANVESMGTAQYSKILVVSGGKIARLTQLLVAHEHTSAFEPRSQLPVTAASSDDRRNTMQSVDTAILPPQKTDLSGCTQSHLARMVFRLNRRSRTILIC